MIEYIAEEDVLEINKIVTNPYGQKSIVLQQSSITHYLDGMKRYGQDIEDETSAIIRKAAYILYHLAYDAHAFMDGNKRTALTVALAFLQKNIENFDDSKIPEEEKAKIVKEIAQGKHSISHIEKWLKTCIK